MSRYLVLLLAKILLIGVGLLLTNHEVVTRIQYFYSRSSYFPLSVILGIWASVLVAIWFIALSPSRRTRIIWAVLIGFSTLAGDLYFRITDGRLTLDAIVAMRDLVLVDVGMIGFYADFIIHSLVSTGILITGIIITPPMFGNLNLRLFQLLPLFPYFLLIGLINYFAVGGINETRGMPNPFYSLSLFTVYALSSTRTPTKTTVQIPLVSKPAVRHIVLIVDESISGDFIDLNEPRGTTPWLLSKASNIINFGLATSASNCSHTSNAILRLGSNPDTLGKKGNTILGNPSIWKYARGAGFTTVYIDPQSIMSGFQDYTNKEERGLIDHYFSSTSGLDAVYRDREVADRLREILARTTPQFVFINKRGTHFPYAGKYPDGQNHFSPAMQLYESVSTRERLVNTYKNAIRWSVDDFFKRLLEQADLGNTVIIYTSDHGQNLLDDGKPVTHCRFHSPSLNEAIVPLLVFTSNAMLFEKFTQSAQVNFNRASHFEIFPTILTLFGYDPEAIRERYHQSLFESINTPLGFVSGDIMNRFGRQLIWISRDGLESHAR